MVSSKYKSDNVRRFAAVLAVVLTHPRVLEYSEDPFCKASNGKKIIQAIKIPICH